VAFKFGHDLCQPVPEFWRMISDLGMGEFVHDHVVNHLWRRHYQPPGETESAIGTARSPARAGRRDADLSPGETIHFGMKSNAGRDVLQGLRPVPTDEDLPGFGEIGIYQMEPVTVIGESGPLRRNDDQGNFFSQIKESFSVDVIYFRRRRGSLGLDLILMDPLFMLLDEFLDVNSRHAERGAYRECAVALDDKGNGLSLGMDEMVDGDSHDG